jgi:Lecithin:cholesterol acyltransferase
MPFTLVRSALLGIATAIGLGVTGNPASAVEIGAPPGEAVRAAVKKLPNAEQVVTKARQVFPVFIFIPGVMGSELTQRTGEVIWGEWPPGGSIEYHEGDEVNTKLLKEYCFVLFGYKVKCKDIYGPAFNLIESLSVVSENLSEVLGGEIKPTNDKEASFQSFSYDWRQSNERTADKLSEWFCERRENLAGRPVVFLAHSMGGLMLKWWLVNKYNQETCNGEPETFNTWLKIRRIVFGGTPHYGAPKTVSSFYDKFMLDSDPVGWGAKILEKASQLTVIKGINEYGATFPSSYELLPITGSDCFSSEEAPPIWVRRLDKGKTVMVDPFSIEIWNEYKWPKLLPKRLEDDKENYIGNSLTKAKQFLCDVLKFKPEPNNFDVWRVVGSDAKKKNAKIMSKYHTLCGITFSPGKSPQNEYCEGDGTVPAWIASEHSFRNNVFEENEEHTSLFGNRSFRAHLEEFHEILHVEFMQKLDGLLTKDQIGDLYAAMQWIVPPAPAEVGVTAERGKSLAAEIEKLVIAKTPGLSPRDIFQQGVDFHGPKVSRAKRAAALRAY